MRPYPLTGSPGEHERGGRTRRSGPPGQWRSGHDPLAPPGITGGSSAVSVAKPLFANGFIRGTVSFTGDAGPRMATG